MHLLVLRHGIAIDRMEASCPSDAERWLTPRGLRRTTLACRGLAALEVAPDLVLTSPLVRARQTAELAAEVLDCPEIRVTEALAGGIATEALFRVLRDLPLETVLCVGHAPQLDLLKARALRAGSARLERLKKAGAALLEFDQGVEEGAGRLRWQMQPRALRDLAKSAQGERRDECR